MGEGAGVSALTEATGGGVWSRTGDGSGATFALGASLEMLAVGADGEDASDATREGAMVFKTSPR